MKNGHPLAWSYTPRELQGWIDLLARLQAGRDAEVLALIATANSGDNKAIQKMHKDLLKLT